MNKPYPPSIARRFFQWYCNPRLQETILGDLEEQFEEDLKASGPRRAKARFTWNVLRFFRPGIIKSFNNGQKLNTYGMYKHYLKIGWRTILRNKLHSFINVIGLSTGAAICLVTLLFYNYETSFDHHHANADQTYRVVQHTHKSDQELYWNTTAYPLAAALRNDFPDFEHVTQVAGPMKRLFKLESEKTEVVRFEEEHVLFADRHYPEVFDLEWISGSKESALDLLNSVVITEKIAEKCFGQNFRSSRVVGQTLLLNNKDALIITGVVKNPPPTTSLKFNMLISYEFFKKHNPYPSGNWSGNYQGTTFVTLKDQSQELLVEDKINNWKGNYLNEVDNEQISYFLQPLKEIHTETLYGSVPTGYQIDKKTLNISIMVALFILFIAVVNFINLVTARASIRSKEVGIRKAIGSSRGSLIKQFLFENSILVIIAMIVACVLSWQLLVLLNNSLSIIGMKLSFHLQEVVLIIGACFLIIVLSTVYPAFVLSSFKPIKALNNSGAGGIKGFSFRKGLTLFQFTLVQIFVISALIVGIQINYFNSKSPGFTSDQIVMIPIPSHDKIDVIANRFLENNQVSQVSFGSGPPMAVNNFALGTNCWLPHQEKLDAISTQMKIADPAYIQLYDLELVAGRNFIENKPQFDEFIINEKLAKSFGWKNPEDALGQSLRINEGEAKVVGVIKDFHNQPFQYELTPVVLMNWTAWQWRAFAKINSFDALIHIEETWKSQFPESIFTYNFLDDSIKKEYLLENLIYRGFKLFSMLVIIIGCLGLLGLMSFITLQKTKEIGVRKVLGASVVQIISNLSKEFSIIIFIGFIVAVPVVYYFMGIWLNNFSYRIELSLWIFIAGGLITFLFGIGISSLKSVKAARANPIESLKY
ncbi:MAG: ABC transporter permease, partial [Ekhidna sp.]